MRVKTSLLLILSFVLYFSAKGPSVNAQQNTLVGPILVGRAVGGEWITFEDVGFNKTWQIKLPNSSFVPQSWSSNGCNLLVRGSGSWAIVSVPNVTLREIPQLSSINSSGQFFSEMIWSYDGRSLTSTVQLSSSDVRIYSVSLDTYATELILSLNTYGGAIRWLSETQLLYRIAGGDYFIWDTIAKKSYLYEQKPQIPSNWLSEVEVYLSTESPNRELSARYYSVNAIRSFISESQKVAPSSDVATVEAIQEDPLPYDISPEYVATGAISKVSGFDVYTFHDGSTKHIDVMRQFLQFLKWAPSSGRIVVTTDPIETPESLNGIYVYTLGDNSLQRIGYYPAMYNSEYGGYEPDWSSDSNWIVFNTPDGYIIYNIITRKTTKLSEQFDGFYTNLQWSPIMDYRTSECDG